MFTIENNQIKAVINAKGAELTQLIHKEHQLDYMWHGDPAVWGKHSPVLFPIVGTLKNNTYFYKEQNYQLPRHGFARDKQFAVEEQTADTITFLLRHDAETLTVFPFAFEFRIRYTLVENALAVTYEVVNTGNDLMYFAVGAHPAFKIPLVPGTAYTDYYLQFNQTETAPRWPISPDGLIESSPLPLLENTSRLNLSKDLFQKDALVFKGMSASIVTLGSGKTSHGFRFDYPGFPFLGIWAAKNADFVCIEPWCGIADSVTTSQQLPEKEGINKLEAGGSFTRTWTITLF
jgi:galactose mutarotase-like enzyme